MPRALITGGAGFIGYHLARELLGQEYEVDLLDNFSRGVQDPDLDELTRQPGVRLLHDDLRHVQPDSLGESYEYIYHFAAIIGVAHVLRRPYDVLRDNAILLLRAIDIAREQSRLDRFIFASTSEVYAGTLEHFQLPIPTHEDVPLTLTAVSHPRTSYMLSKIHGEALCQHAGVPFTVVRPHNFYGPRMGLSHVVPELLKKAHEAPAGGVVEVASPGHRRTFCYISDAVRTIRMLAEAPAAAGLTANIGSDRDETSMADLAGQIVRTVGKPLTIRPLADTPGSPARRCPDISRAVSVTGYKPMVSLPDGLRLTYAWYRERVFEGHVASAQ